MKSIEAYKRFLIKLNKNDTNTNINIGKGEFVLIFNEQSKVWLENKLKEDSNLHDKNEISALLVYDKKLEKVIDTSTFSQFKLPDDYYEYQTSYSIASKGKCKDRKLLNWDFKVRNKNVLEQDENNNPSFEYEETIANVSGDNILIFKKDFDIDEQYVTYYKEPNNIDIKGYIRFDGSSSEDIDSELADKYVNEIISLCVVSVEANYGNVEQYQMQKQQINN